MTLWHFYKMIFRHTFSFMKHRYFIKKYREASGLTQTQLADTIGWKQERFSLLESGKRKLTFETADAVAKILKCTPHELFYGEIAKDGDTFSSKQNIKELVAFLLAGLLKKRAVTDEAKSMIATHLTFSLDYDAQHDGIKSPDKYADLAVAFLESSKKQKGVKE